MAEGAMEVFLSNVGEFFTQTIAWFGEALEIVLANPALMVLVIAMPICGFAVGLLGRLIRL